MRTSACTPPAEPVVRPSSSALNARFTKSISSRAGPTARYAVTLWMPSRRVSGVVAVVMVALLIRSAPSRALNAGRGRSRSSSAMRSSSASSGSAGDGFASSASSASARRSIRAFSVIDVPHPGPQGLEGPVLELLDRALRALQLLRDLPDALLLDEALQQHALLVRRQAAHQIGEHGAAIHLHPAALLARQQRLR